MVCPRYTCAYYKRPDMTLDEAQEAAGRSFQVSCEGFHQWRYPRMDGLWKKKTIKMDDLGVPLFQETSMLLFLVPSLSTQQKSPETPADRPRWTWLRRNWIWNLACRWADRWLTWEGRSFGDAIGSWSHDLDMLGIRWTPWNHPPWFLPRNVTWNWHQFMWLNSQTPKASVWFTNSHHCPQALFGVRIWLWRAGVDQPSLDQKVDGPELLTCAIKIY